MMYASGATLVAVCVVLSGESTIHRAGILAICMFSAAAAIVIYALGPRYSLALTHASSATGSILVCVAVALAGGTSLSFLCGMLLVWVALYGAVFYTPQLALGHIWLGAIGHAAALATLPPGSRWAPWLMTTGTCHVVLFSYRLIERLSRRLRAIVEHSGGVVLVLDREHRIKLVGGGPDRVLHCPGEELLGRSVLDRIHPEDRPHFTRVVTSSSAGDGMPRTLEVRMLRDDAVWIHADVTAADASEDPSLDGIVVTLRDVTERKLLEEQLKYQAFHDPLTGLPNRALFAEHVERALKQRRPDDVALLFVDLDDFKRVNDTFGHSEGDALLRAVADRLRTVIRDGDVAARLGGDEFAILLGGPLGSAEVRSVTDRVLGAMRAPVTLGERDVQVGASVGVVTNPGPASVEEVLRNADLALYAAKNGGKGRAEHFHAAMHRELVERVDLESELRRALDEGQLAVHYQPIVDLTSRRTTAVEALLRWHHPTRGMLSAAHFVPLAEDTGSIRQLGRWVLEQACVDVERLRAVPGVDDRLSVSVNVSGRQLQDPSFVGQVEQALGRSGLPADHLLLEITETILLEHLDRIGEDLHELRRRGTNVAIDDFGTGYSSLAHLRRLPVDVLKIAREFTAELTGNPDDLRVTSTIVSLGHSLGLRVIAEGIERSDQAERLLDIGCGEGQGYLYAYPMPLPDLRRFLLSPAIAPSRDWHGQPVGTGL